MSNLEEYSHHKKALFYVKNSIKELFFDKSNYYITPLSVFLGGLLAVYVSIAPETIAITLKIADIVLTTQLGIFACFMAAYTFVMTYMSEEYMKLLHDTPYGESTYLAKVTAYLRMFSFVYSIGVIYSFLTKVFLTILDDSFVMFTNNTYNVITSTIALFIYFVYSIRLIFELKSLVHNITIVLFGKITFQVAEMRGAHKYDSNK